MVDPCTKSDQFLQVSVSPCILAHHAFQEPRDPQPTQRQLSIRWTSIDLLVLSWRPSDHARRCSRLCRLYDHTEGSEEYDEERCQRGARLGEANRD